MRSLEKFLGLKVSITKELDPMRIDVLAKGGLRILELKGYNPDEYSVYIHQLLVRRTGQRHFGVASTIEDRIDQMSLIFAVNPKQRKNKSIKFLNYLSDAEPSSEVRQMGVSDEITYLIPGAYLEQYGGFRNEIITFVKRGLRIEHRKIKISVIASPTELFLRKIQKKTYTHRTQFDFGLNNITLGSASRRIEKQPTIGKPEDEVIRTIESENAQIIIVGSGGTVDMSRDKVDVHDVVGPVNVKSRLDHVTQIVNNAQSLRSDDRAELCELLQKLQNALAPVEKEKPEDAERVVQSAEMVAAEVTKNKPSKNFLGIAIAGLTEAAKAVQTIAPTVVTIAGKIAEFVGGLF